jgi:hypothetical protein
MTSVASSVRAGAFLGAVLASTLVLFFTATPTLARDQNQYKTPEEAAAALANAVRADDNRMLLSILGRQGSDIISSGDATEDKAKRKEFIEAYDARHELAVSADKTAILNIGPKDFPFPIPLVREKEGWRFDTQAGRAEVLARRIGRNELSAIQAVLAYYDAQHDYVDKDRSGKNIREFAQRIASTPGKQDGLYWPTAAGGEQSPLGELVADASADGYAIGKERAPYHGYYYKVLTKQGAAANGGALNYVVGGHMIGGFALVAYPANYGVSGVMTFMISHNGVVYQKDLGERTERIAERMTAFDPGAGWETVRVTTPPPNED